MTFSEIAKHDAIVRRADVATDEMLESAARRLAEARKAAHDKLKNSVPKLNPEMAGLGHADRIKR